MVRWYEIMGAVMNKLALQVGAMAALWKIIQESMLTYTVYFFLQKSIYFNKILRYTTHSVF